MTGSGGGAGIDPERVAELIVTTKGPGPDRRGPGYRITAEAVLTAAHVVRDEAGVRVRFDADRSGEWVAAALVAVDRRRGVALAAHMEREIRHWTPDQPLAQTFNLGGLAVVLANVDRERAVALAAEAEQAVGEVEGTGRDEALAVVASALAAVEQWDRAERAVMTITDADTLTKAVGELAGAFVGAGRWDDAQRITNAILDPEAKVQALAALAGSLVTVDPERALAVAAEAADTVPTIPGRYDQAKAWALIVELLTAASASDPVAGDALHQQVRRLLAEVLAGARWLDALETLGKLEPGALAAVDQELRRR
jgi:hypothetical protein